jgi:proline racemase
VRWKLAFNVVDAHAEGEVGRVVTGGIGDIPGETVFDKRVYLQEHRDQIRQLLLFEPRGSVVQNANIIVPATDPRASYGYVILESTEYPVMSGSNTMCVATVLLETGMTPMVEPITHLLLESPAGLIEVDCECRDGKVVRTRLINQPAFVYALNAVIDIPHLGALTVDIAYGGMTYVLVNAADVKVDLQPSEARKLCHLGQRIKTAAAEQVAVAHPEKPEIPGITQTVFCGPVDRIGRTVRSRNAVVVSPGRIDRSPCGTGTSARLAVLHARGDITTKDLLVHESIIGTTFDARVEGITTVGPYDAVIPSVAGQAWITAMGITGLDPTDPFPHGATLADTWMSPEDV